MQPTPPQWPDQPQAPQAQQPPTPGGGPSRSRLTMTLGIVSIVSVVVIVALIGTLIVVLQHGAQSGGLLAALQPGATSQQTATTSSVQATSTAEGTPVTSGNGGTTPRSTATPKPSATPAGPPSVRILSRAVTGKSNSPIIVTCSKGELALSGGWTSSVRNIPISFSKRSGNGWQVLINTLNVGLTPTATVYVVCLQHVAGAAVTERQSTESVNTGESRLNPVACNSGEVDVGGGIEVPGFTLKNLTSTLSPAGFSAFAFNDTGATQSYKVYAECLRAAGAMTAYGPISSATLNPGASVSIQATCPSGLIAGGSLGGGDSASTPYDYSASNSVTWQGHVVNQGTATLNITLSAVCLSFA